MIEATRRIQFCAGHRVFRHESKCRHLHGHNYVALIHATAPHLDDLGRVIDFGVLKECVGKWIDDHWDHRFILFAGDAEAIDAVRQVNRDMVYLLHENPTAENMAMHLLVDVCPAVLGHTNVKVTKVTLWETENCYAEVSL